jgi:hypothetical protein
MTLVRALESDDTALDFERLLPTPQRLLDGGDYHAPDVADGLPGWYQWRREHWGVKYNAWCVTRRGFGRTGRVRYRFNTPYGPPIEFLDAVAGMAPEIEIDLRFDVELLGGGVVRWRSGRCRQYEESLA